MRQLLFLLLTMLLVAAPVLAETPELVATVGAEVGRAEFKVYRKSRIGELTLRLSGRQVSAIWLKKSDWQRFLSKLETATAKRPVGSTRNTGSGRLIQKRRWSPGGPPKMRNG